MGRKKLFYPDMESLRAVTAVLNEAAVLVNGNEWSLRDGKLTQAIGGTMGGVAGTGAAVGAIAVCGEVGGLSAAGISSGLAAIGGSMLVGLCVLPVAAVGGIIIGSSLVRHSKNKKLKETKLELYNDAVAKNTEISKFSTRILTESENRHVIRVNALLENIIDNLKSDLKEEKIPF